MRAKVVVLPQLFCASMPQLNQRGTAGGLPRAVEKGYDYRSDIGIEEVEEWTSPR
jgi:hypothetical protein